LPKCTLQTKSANYTFLWTEKNNTGFSTDTTSWNITYDLDLSLFPTTNGLYEFTFCKTTGDTNKVIIDVWSGNTIDNSQTYELTTQWETVTIKIASSIFAKVTATSNKPTPSPVVASTKSTFVAGENITAWNALALDDFTISTFSSSTDISKASNNKRTALKIVWSWVSWNILKLILKKTWTPTQNLNIRIETDNAWEPSWTLVDINAIWSILQSSLTTSLAETSITLSWSITLTNWATYWVILNNWTYWSETIDWTNYYSIWYNVVNNKTYAIYTLVADWIDNNQFIADVPTSMWAQTYRTWIKVTATSDTFVSFLTKHSSVTATKAYITDSSLNVLVSANFSWNIATFSSPYLLQNWVTYYLLVDNNWGSYTPYWNWWGSTFPLVRTWFNVIAGRWSSDYGTSVCSITYVDTQGSSPDYSLLADKNHYAISTIINPWVYKTDASNTAKLNFIWFATETILANANVLVDTWWVSTTQSGLTIWTENYLSNTPWAIASTPWTNVVSVWKTIRANAILIKDNKNLQNPSSRTPWVNYLASTDWFVHWWINSDWSWWDCSIQIYSDTSATPTTQISSWAWYVGSSTDSWFCCMIKKWNYYRVDMVWQWWWVMFFSSLT